MLNQRNYKAIEELDQQIRNCYTDLLKLAWWGKKDSNEYKRIETQCEILKNRYYMLTNKY